MRAAGRAGADAGAGDDGDHRADARRQRDRRRARCRSPAMRPDVLGINCATGPAEMQEHLRYLSQHSPLPISVLPNAGLPSIVDGRTHYDLTPAAARRVPPPPRHRARHRRRRRLLRHDARAPRARWSRRSATSSRPAARPTSSRASSSIYSPVADRAGRSSFLIIGERTNANGSQGVPRRDARRRLGRLHEDGQRADPRGRPRARRLRRLRRPRRRRRHGRDRQALRHPGQRAAGARLAPSRRCSRPALQHIGGRAILNSANLEDGELPGSRFDRVMSLAREYGAAVICLLIDERGQARDVEWKMEIAHRIHQIATERYGLSANDLIFDALTFPLSTGDDDLRATRWTRWRRSGGSRPRSPARSHDARRVQRQLRPARRPARHALNSVFLHECRAGRARLGDRPRRQDRAAEPAARRAARGLPRPDLRPPPTRAYDPLQELLEVFADVKSVKTVEKLDRSGWPVEERLQASASSTATATA